MCEQSSKQVTETQRESCRRRGSHYRVHHQNSYQHEHWCLSFVTMLTVSDKRETQESCSTEQSWGAALKPSPPTTPWLPVVQLFLQVEPLPSGERKETYQTEVADETLSTAQQVTKLLRSLPKIKSAVKPLLGRCSL